MKRYEELKHITAFITLGRSATVGITKFNELVFVQNEMTSNPQIVNVGPCTQQRVKEIQEYLGRLAIHLPEA